MVTPGGEVAFVTRMIEESLHLNTRVQWYTSMLGKLSSVTEIVERLKENQNDNWCVTEFVQGTRTKRWAVAWSWADMRPTMVTRPMDMGCSLEISWLTDATGCRQRDSPSA